MNKLKRCYGKYHNSKPIPLDEFGKNKSSSDGIAKVCKKCNSRYEKERRQIPEVLARQKQTSKDYYQRNKDGYVERKRKLITTERGYIGKMVAQARCRAREKNQEFSITTEDVIIPKVCPVLNIPLIIGATRQEKNNSPSIDRIDSSKGYTKNNIIIISWRANKLKSNSTVKEMKQLYEFYEGILNGDSEEA